MGDLRLVLDAAPAFTRTHPAEVAVHFGCCEVAYVGDGQVDAGLALVWATYVRIAPWICSVGGQVPFHSAFRACL